MTALPLDFPPLRAAAEEMAREHYAATLVVGDLGTPGISEESATDNAARLPAALIQSQVRVHARLLADPTRPASRDFWGRWLARHHGLTVGATAPGWMLLRKTGVPTWCLGGISGWRWFDGIDPLLDPAAALALACLHAAGRLPAKE